MNGLGLIFKVACPCCGAINELPLPYKGDWIVCASCSQKVTLALGPPTPKPKKTLAPWGQDYEPDFETWFETSIDNLEPMTSHELLAGHAGGLFKDHGTITLEHYAKQFEKITGIHVSKSLKGLLAWAANTTLTTGAVPPTRADFMIASMDEVLTMNTLKGARRQDAQDLRLKYKLAGTLSDNAMSYFCDLLYEGYKINKWPTSFKQDLIPNFTGFKPTDIPLTMIDS